MWWVMEVKNLQMGLGKLYTSCTFNINIQSTINSLCLLRNISRHTKNFLSSSEERCINFGTVASCRFTGYYSQFFNPGKITNQLV